MYKISLKTSMIKIPNSLNDDKMCSSIIISNNGRFRYNWTEWCKELPPLCLYMLVSFSLYLFIFDRWRKRFAYLCLSSLRETIAMDFLNFLGSLTDASGMSFCAHPGLVQRNTFSCQSHYYIKVCFQRVH